MSIMIMIMMNTPSSLQLGAHVPWLERTMAASERPWSCDPD